MFQWLNILPNFVIALLFGVVGAGLAAGVQFFREKLLRIHVSEDHFEAARGALDVVIYLTGLVLAFSFIRAQGDQRNLETHAELLKKAAELAADRETRIVAAAQLKFPSVFWLTITFLLITLLVLATFTEATLGHATALGGLGFGIALLVALVFVFDEPFKGETSVSPKPIINSVPQMQARKE